jgi:hypothetical protein
VDGTGTGTLCRSLLVAGSNPYGAGKTLAAFLSVSGENSSRL